AETVRDLVVDLGGEVGQAAKGCLDVSPRTAKSVVEAEMAHGRVEIVIPNELHRAAAKPDAFRITGRAVDGAGRFVELLDLALAIVDRRRAGRLAGLLGGLVVALGESTSDAKEGDQPGNCEAARNCILKIKYPSPHEFPDCCLFDRFVLNPLAGCRSNGTPMRQTGQSHDPYCEFCPAVTTLSLCVVTPLKQSECAGPLADGRLPG